PYRAPAWGRRRVAAALRFLLPGHASVRDCGEQVGLQRVGVRPERFLRRRGFLRRRLRRGRRRVLVTGPCPAVGQRGCRNGTAPRIMPRTGSSAAGKAGAWPCYVVVGSRELCQLRTEADWEARHGSN